MRKPVIYIVGGYRRIRMPDGRSYAEHRLVAEEMLGRPLLDTEVVHHKNGDKLDNRPENLEVCASQKEHLEQHRQTLRLENQKQCSKCGRLLDLDEFYKRNEREHGHFSQCKDCISEGRGNTRRMMSVYDGDKKLCTKCGEFKELSAFADNASKKDGKASTCRECKRRYDQARK